MVRRAVCLPFALARFSVIINVDFDVRSPRFTFLVKQSSYRPFLESGILECSAVRAGAGFMRSARKGRNKPIMQHIPCPTSSNSPAQARRARSCLLLESGEDYARVDCVTCPHDTHGQPPPGARELPQRSRLCFAAADTLFSHCFTGVGGVLL